VGEALVRSDGHRREQHSPVGELAALDAAEVLDHVGDVAAGSTASMNTNAWRPV